MEASSEGLHLVTVLAAVLDRLISANLTVVASNNVTKFHALKPPSITVLEYLLRIHKYARCSAECFVLALIYIDRLIQRNNFILSSLNVHRVVITSVMLAAKFFDDQYFNNAYYAKVGGVPCTELNQLEVDFLFRVNFNLRVTTEDYFRYHAELVTHANAALEVSDVGGGGESAAAAADASAAAAGPAAATVPQGPPGQPGQPDPRTPPAAAVGGGVRAVPNPSAVRPSSQAQSAVAGVHQPQPPPPPAAPQSALGEPRQHQPAHPPRVRIAQ